MARTFFTTPGSIGVASGENYPDALAAGPWLAAGDAPLLLTGANTLPSSTTSYVAGLATGTQLHAFGGPVAVSAGVQQALVHAAS